MKTIQELHLNNDQKKEVREIILSIADFATELGVRELKWEAEGLLKTTQNIVEKLQDDLNVAFNKCMVQLEAQRKRVEERKKSISAKAVEEVKKII